MKTAILGPGALGSLFGAYLTQGGMEVVILDHRQERARRLTDKGISIQGVRGEHVVFVPVTTDTKAVGQVELVVVCVKSYQTEDALRMHQALIGHGTTVWSIQNGLGNTEAMARVVRIDQVVGGSTTMAANLIEPGVVHHAADGESCIGEIAESTRTVGTGSSPRVETLASKLTAAGIPVQVRTDIQRVIWSKLITNVGINALTAILRVKNGALLESEASRKLMEAAVSEAVKAAAAHGHDFSESQMFTQVKEVARLTGENRSSMLQDILQGRRTEIDSINGAIARQGSSPVNATLMALIKALEATACSRL